jgi:hypothetical protein
MPTERATILSLEGILEMREGCVCEKAKANGKLKEGGGIGLDLIGWG